MPRGVVRAAAYLPASTDGSRRLRTWDEDAFTMVATALERAGRGCDWAGRTVEVTLLGDGQGIDAGGLGAVLGAPVHLTPFSDTDPESTLLEVSGRPGPQWVVAVATDAGSPAPPPGEGALAVLVDESERSYPLTQVKGPAGVGPFAALLGGLRASLPPTALRGDWDSEPGRGRPLRARTSSGAESTPTVSQGAYVPVARDEENRASRWRFVADRCRDCGGVTFPQRGRCRHCGRVGTLAPEELPLDGASVVASTWIGAGGQPTEFDAQVAATGPYGVVIAEIVPGVRATLAVADAGQDEVGLNSRIDTRLRRLYAIDGDWRYGRKAVPALPTRSARASPP